MAYCLANDLLLPMNFQVPSGDAEKFINAAAAEMDSKLGYLYKVPIDPSVGLPSHEAGLLKDINVKLASGRLIMAMALGGQATEVNQYALYLIREAEQNLLGIANGTIDLHAPAVDVTGAEVGEIPQPEETDRFARIPGGWNPDAESPVTIFEQNFMGRTFEPMTWTPGDR